VENLNEGEEEEIPIGNTHTHPIKEYLKSEGGRRIQKPILKDGMKIKCNSWRS